MTFSHFDEAGRARMVDVGGKKMVPRRARAEGWVRISADTAVAIRERSLPKGGPVEVARIAGIAAAKRTADSIPLCHNLSLDFVDVAIELKPDDGFYITSEVACRQATGVEMEALHAVAVAALTLYDMCKAVDQAMQIDGIRLLEKQKGNK